MEQEWNMTILQNTPTQQKIAHQIFAWMGTKHMQLNVFNITKGKSFFIQAFVIIIVQQQHAYIQLKEMTSHTELKLINKLKKEGHIMH